MLLGDLFDGGAVQEAQGLMKDATDATPFKVATALSVAFFLVCIDYYSELLTCVIPSRRWCVFDKYMARYCVSQQHQFSRPSTLREGVWTLYGQDQAESRPELFHMKILTYKSTTIS